MVAQLVCNYCSRVSSIDRDFYLKLDTRIKFYTLNTSIKFSFDPHFLQKVIVRDIQKSFRGGLCFMKIFRHYCIDLVYDNNSTHT